MRNKLYILPFDHRGSFKRILGVKDPLAKKDVKKIKDSKKMIYSAFKKAKLSKEDAGILVDETYGKDILLDAKKKMIITCYTLEKSGQKEFFFDRKDYKKRLDYFQPKYAKVLLRYNPAGNKAMNKRQTKRLFELTKYLKKKKIGFLLEVLEIPTEKQLKKYKSKTVFDHKIRAKLMVEAISELQQAGVNPDIWKLEGLYKKELMEKVAEQVISFNPQARIVVLGRGENAKKAEQWIRTAAKVEAVIGFAVGRTVFQQPLVNYQNKKISKSQAINKIKENYLRFVTVFEKEKMKQQKKIYIGSDHAGFKLKRQIKDWLKIDNVHYQDLGNVVLDVTDDYPDYAEKVARKVVKEKTLGVLICGSAEGVCIAANKIKGVRAVTPFSLKSARLAREHNDANIICLSGWFENFYKTTKMLKVFLNTSFSGEKRHVRRINKIKKMEK
ncbi:RpiB/LacA/LacB family sugar-phosphate isomerase [archaeon]|nr:RpiB/LacA/LacB family sugar-phosphate isomerase [Candidatus Woesearchaeota archaeon]MBT4376208.1 RpiB/LacA/LacB family sugar-phosphate isomerase [archaeon]